MLRVSLKNMWAHKRRFFGTIFAVVLGVTFLSGTLVLGDTLRAGFDDLFSEANAGLDAVVRSASEVEDDGVSVRELIDISLTEEVRAVDGVRAAEPVVNALGQLVDRDGDALGGEGPPTLASSWITDERLNPWRLAEGRAPAADGEVVVDRQVADDAELSLGDTATLLTPGPVELQVVGIARFGEEDSLGPITYAALTLDYAQALFVPDATKVSEISVGAEDGVGEDELVRNIDAVLPDGLEALSGAELTDEDNQEINDAFLGFFETFLLVFAGIALLVATFSIYNTFSIIVAQRTRESALLRAIGASRGQVLTSIGLESVFIGLVASVLGLLAGIGLAAGLRALFDALGFGIPAGALTVKPSTIVAAFAVGMLVTLLATVYPALRASRVAPLAALRDVAIERVGASVARVVVGVLFAAGGAALVIAAAVGGSGIWVAGSGAVLVLIGVIVLGPVVAKPAAGALGAPLPRLKRMTGRLARDNAMRNPKRTAATASALLVGVAVVTLFTVFAASVKAAIDEAVNGQFGGDLVIATQQFSGAGLSPDLTAAVGELSEVDTATGLGIGVLVVDGDDTAATNVEPESVDRLLDLGVQEGSLAELTDRQIAVSAEEADTKGWVVGDAVSVTFPSDGFTTDLEIGALYDKVELVGDFVVSKALWNAHTTQPSDIVVMIQLADGVSIDDGKAAVQEVADQFFAPDVQDREEYVQSVAGQIDIFLTIIYALLALAIIIALFGIANTLSLSVYERIRELGLLRAVGQSRGQLRSMVRWESIIIAVFGTVGGIVVGLFLGWGIVEVVAEAENIAAPFTVPLGQVFLVLIVGAGVGLAAGWRPARRASKLDILDAIATD